MMFDYKLKIEEEENFRYHTKIYSEVMEEIALKGVKQEFHKKALDWFFYRDRIVPLHEKKSIKEVHVLEKDRIFAIFSGNHDIMFKNVKYLGLKTGWYFYITGLPLEKDEITEYIDNLGVAKKDLNLNWEVSENFKVVLIPIGVGSNHNSYLIKIVDKESLNEKNILLDAGVELFHLERLKRNINSLDLIFISHAHSDHIKGLSLLSKHFPDTPIISSRTTFEFYILYNWYVGEKFLNNRHRIDQISHNYFFVKSDDIIEISKIIQLKFYYAGHIPGALMFYMNIHDFSFLFSGDFSMYDNFPIAGVWTDLQKLPNHIDFCLVDGSFSSETYDAPSYIFDIFKDKITRRVEHYNKILIAADYGSSALVLFFTLFKHFREIQRRLGLKAIRPSIYLSENIKRFFQIMTYNKEGIHPYLQKQIKFEHNPFQSAIIKWISDFRDLYDGFERKGGIFILPNASLTNSMIQKALELISSYKHNLIYLCGPLRTEAAIELVSGNDTIQLKDKEIHNKAKVWNREYPNLVLNLHADGFQLKKLLKQINPNHVCFFQQSPRKLVKVRSDLLKEFANLITSVIYSNQEILIYSGEKSIKNID